MKAVSALVLLLLLTSALAPPVLVPPPGGSDETPTLAVLDVCHGSITGVSPDLPFLSVCPCIIAPLSLGEIVPLCKRAVNPLLFVRPIEEPPVVLS